MESISKLTLLTLLAAAVVVPAGANQPATRTRLEMPRFTLGEKVAAGLVVLSGIVAGYPLATGDFKKLRALQKRHNCPTPRSSYAPSYDEYSAKQYVDYRAIDALKALKPKVYYAIGIGALGMVAAGALLAKECIARKKSEKRA